MLRLVIMSSASFESFGARPWVGGRTLILVLETGIARRALPLIQDVHRMVMGMVWQKLSFKISPGDKVNFLGSLGSPILCYPPCIPWTVDPTVPGLWDHCSVVRRSACISGHFANDTSYGVPINIILRFFEQVLVSIEKCDLHFDFGKTTSHVLARDAFKAICNAFEIWGSDGYYRDESANTSNSCLERLPSFRHRINLSRSDLAAALIMGEKFPPKCINPTLLKQYLQLPKLANWAWAMPR